VVRPIEGDTNNNSKEFTSFNHINHTTISQNKLFGTTFNLFVLDLNIIKLVSVIFSDSLFNLNHIDNLLSSVLRKVH